MEDKIQESVVKVTHKDVQEKVKAKKWFYTDIVKDHFFNPRNILIDEEKAEGYAKKADGIGMVGSPACGDMMKVWLKIDKDNNKIKEAKFQTFGCASAIASTSIMTVMLTENGGMGLDKAMKLGPKEIVKRLGDLPARKFHCSVLGDKALREAINDYYRKTGQTDKIIIEGARIIDKMLKISDKDIEEAVLDGCLTFEDVQKKTKIGIQDKTCIPEAQELIRFYKEKYFG